MKTEAKVGAFTLAGLVLLAGLLVYLSDFSLGSAKDYTIYAGFRQVVGVEPQAQVCLSGVPVGTVTSIDNEGGGVTVAMKIHADVRIPEGSHVTIGSPGVMGEKFINITPAEDLGHYVSDGAYLIGDEEQGLDQMFANINGLVLQAQDMLTSLNGIVGDEKFRTSILGMVVNMRETTAHLSGLMAELEAMVAENRGNIHQMTTNLVTVTESLNRTLANTEQMMTNLNSVLGDPQTAENLRETLENIKNTSVSVEHIATNLETVAGDPETATKLKETIDSAHSITQKADGMLGDLGSIEVTPSVDALYSGKEDDWSFNGNLRLAEGKRFIDLGVDDIGDDSLFNAQVGRKKGALGLRGGVVAGKVGVGVDAYAGKDFTLSADAYDPGEGKLRLRASYDLGGGTALLGQMNDVTDSDERTGYLGLRQSF